MHALSLPDYWKPKIVNSPLPPLIREVGWREEVSHRDLAAVQEIVAATGFFTTAEIGIAVELVAERLAKGAESGYEFILAEMDSVLVGYACYGEIPCTVGSYDVYWIVVHPSHQRAGLGRQLLWRTEQAIRNRCGRRIYIDTSGNDRYQPTRSFYTRCGFQVAAELSDFYDEGDAKLVFSKNLTQTLLPESC